ncbi:MAG TPA: hypothetical protein VGM23_03270, partial [Armatimonadota bacterium]
MRPPLILHVLQITLLLGCTVLVPIAYGQENLQRGSVLIANAFEERFNTTTLNPDLWVMTRKNDSRESLIDIVPERGEEKRLRLRASPVGVVDRISSFHGIRSVKPVVKLGPCASVSFDLDWNNQINGCFMTAGIYICPTATEGTPEDERDWVKIEYIGVPPGQNARLEVANKNHGNVHSLFTDGWPGIQRTGRKIGLVHTRVVLTTEEIALYEEDKLLFQQSFKTPQGYPIPIKWTDNSAYLYIQQTSNNVYPAREVFFDNIKVQSAPPLPPSEKPTPDSTIEKTPGKLGEGYALIPNAFYDNFMLSRVNPDFWVITRKNDFKESIIDVVTGPNDDRRLRLRASTIGTDGKTLKYHGIRTIKPVIKLDRHISVSFDLDWNNQVNGCMLGAGIYICPTATEGTPVDEREWVRVEYIGVPPGKNARLYVTEKWQGCEYIVYDEGWPDKQRTGRKIGLVHARIVITTDEIALYEEDKLIFVRPLKNNVDGYPITLKWPG